MCAVGGPPDLGDPELLFSTDYICLACKSKFRGIGVNPRCPKCESENVKREE
ncbi:MAG: hypothetical protein LUQ38_02445 [Methanotrichaceae archaeon]|nr:hypothetical protein [Methanotrichaceae archaeon]